MRAAIRLALCSASALAVVVATGCGTDFPTCYADEYRACGCTNGANGYQQCLPSQDGFAACVCDGKTPGTAADAGLVASGSKGFLEPCQTSAECLSGVCGIFPSRGNKCTKPCTTDMDCPAPSPGCNPQAICKSP
ncbi:MAG TPA: hypothetical protein VIF62_33190 [Labilithrix sp.]|jgi:hypothetical protein